MRRKKQILFTLFLLFGSYSLVSQNTFFDQNRLINDSIKSKVLDETRYFSIVLPKKYIESNKEYPVLYLLDGENHLFHIVGLVDYLYSIGRIPEFIIIGINSEDRYRDYTPEPIEEHPGTGSAKNFLDFLDVELMQRIDNEFRTHECRFIFGHSYAGTFVLNAFLERPDLFNGYITASPNLFIVKDFSEKFENNLKNKVITKELIYACAGEYEKDFTIELKKIDNIFDNCKIEQFNWSFDILEGEGHSSTPHKCMYNALNIFFKNFWNISH